MHPAGSAMQELIHAGTTLYRSCPMWGAPPNKHPVQGATLGCFTWGFPHTGSMQELINTGTNSPGFLHISDLLLHTDLLLTYLNPSLSSLSGPWKRWPTPALSYRQVLTHQYLYLTVSSLVAEPGNLPSPRSRLQGFPSEGKLS